MQKSSEIFAASTGGAMKMCEDLQVPFLGSLPLDPKIARCSDEGKNFIRELPDSPVVLALNTIVESMLLFSWMHLFLFHFSGLMKKCD